MRVRAVPFSRDGPENPPQWKAPPYGEVEDRADPPLTHMLVLSVSFSVLSERCPCQRIKINKNY
ncbi:MAG: hypothetical protein MjAS7_0442 [Metallosphaera javensis (ex Sakai et al. 2022)]|nr:MAG: hypothetical protein MjAS7_0442 [Metallosphaera javensis (ex Sakai et al. 2022)]